MSKIAKTFDVKYCEKDYQVLITKSYDSTEAVHILSQSVLINDKYLVHINIGDTDKAKRDQAFEDYTDEDAYAFVIRAFVKKVADVTFGLN